MHMQRALTQIELASVFSSRRENSELVGIEVENGLVNPKTGSSIPYSGVGGARELLENMADEFDGKLQFTDGAYPVGVEVADGASFSLETGGALEYASKPSASLAQTVRTARNNLLKAATVAGRSGIALLSGANLPFTPKNEIPWIPKPRVNVMLNYFDELGDSGIHAEAVMGLTLSTQTSLDYISERDLFEKMRLHVMAAPIIAALFVNSPIAEGDYCGVQSRRMQYWQKFDPRRCGVLGFALNKNIRVQDLIEWALEMPMIYRNVNGSHVVAPACSFGDIVQSGFGDGSWPTVADWELHLCQLWPHVRPRQTLELRALDGLPWPHFSAAPAIWVGLTYDATVLREASTLLSELTLSQLQQSTSDIAVKGLAASIGPHQVGDLAHELLRLSLRGLGNRVSAGIDPPEVLSYLEPLWLVDETRETFADKCIAMWHGELNRLPEAYVEYYRLPF